MTPVEANKNLNFEKLYKTGPQFSNVDIHGGGLLFGVVYKECLKFNSDSTVTITYQVIDSFWQMENESEKIEKEIFNSKFEFTDRGYIRFSVNGKNYYGSICFNNPETIAFHVYEKSRDFDNYYGIVYELEK
ncbi:MAG: hypothetical protein LWW74_05720 [Burkholderiales bacterium]|nr:hypothetical protein [Burkholderiales bacterium]